MFSLLPYPRQTDPGSDAPRGEQRLKSRQVRICLVADSGLSGDGVRHRCADLVARGASVTVLDVAAVPGTAPSGVEVVPLRTLFEPQHDFTPLRSLCVYHWLAPPGLTPRVFDWVLFTDGFGTGYYSVTAKRLGLAFGQTLLAVLADTGHARTLEHNQRFPQGRTDIERDFLERRTVRGADALITTGPAFVDWCRRAGWMVPDRCLRWPELDLTPPAPPLPPLGPPRPLVSVCLATYNRPGPVRKALDSLRRQTYPRIEVVLIDDGSTDPGMPACLAELAPDFQARGWTLMRQANAGPGAARNAAVRRARGDYVLFMDDDNLALAHEIERFVTAALASGADVLTCIPGRHPETTVGPAGVAKLPTADAGYPVCAVDWTPVGASLALCAMINCLGDGNALYKRSVFEALGGFPESRDSFEDLRLLMLAVVRGYRLEVVPEILFLYCRHQGSRSMGSNLFHCHVDVLHPLTELIPPELWPLLLTAHGDWYRRHLSCSLRS